MWLQRLKLSYTIKKSIMQQVGKKPWLLLENITLCRGFIHQSLSQTKPKHTKPLSLPSNSSFHWLHVAFDLLLLNTAQGHAQDNNGPPIQTKKKAMFAKLGSDIMSWPCHLRGSGRGAGRWRWCSCWSAAQTRPSPCQTGVSTVWQWSRWRTARGLCILACTVGNRATSNSVSVLRTPHSREAEFWE